MKATPGFEPAAIALPVVRHEIRQGLVFVNLDGNASPLGPQLRPLASEIREFEIANQRLARIVDWGECPWDWKINRDNGDSYHHVGIHRQSLAARWPISLIWDAPNNGNYSLTGCGTARDYLVVGADASR